MARPFVSGESVLFIDRKARTKLVVLNSNTQHHTHTGTVEMDDVIGAEEGVMVTTTGGAKYRVVRPTLSDYVLRMKRGAQVIYPKDLGPLLILADVFPGTRVLEAGVGSGALSMTLLRAGAHVTGYDLREDFAARARQNVTDFLGPDVATNYRVEVRDVYEGIEERDLDRVVLDLPEPWRVVPHAAQALRSGGLLVSYLPSITQVSRLREALADSEFDIASTIEVMERGWHIEGRAVRPDHRMVAHTGFLTQARLLRGPAFDGAGEGEVAARSEMDLAEAASGELDQGR